MQHRTVQDVMTQEVVTARPETPFKEVAALFHRNDITAIPVLDDQGHPLGMVSEADLIRKEAVLPDPEGRYPGRWLDAHDRARAEAETAGGLMTSPAVTARPGWSVPEAARAMDKHKVKRLPVVDEVGRLVGIVSRRDLLQVFLRHDAAIREEITHDVLGRTLWLAPDDVQVAVHDGVVTLGGRVPRRSLIPISEQLCRAVDGVVAVHQSLDWTEDDTELLMEHPRAYRPGR
ncbi:CBS domain-containing protein [Kitasatospora sp. CM 4170]|uniref:CBS domain-containing protein n=1 Tax=Kitasatospora aburaviensis TaxID=67265 RepID=A0ABW1F6F2_9ACTN|nr:CBS domain-containing protein [Kitasatospora sp. CM 4170]WNM43346.1 CBS domain-containing protein [Kitasatospora sp. CM 4170]